MNMDYSEMEYYILEYLSTRNFALSDVGREQYLAFGEMGWEQYGPSWARV